MAAPMTASGVMKSTSVRDREIRAKENAILARLSRTNSNNRLSAQNKVNSQARAYGKRKPVKGKTFVSSYETQKIKGADQGFSKSDYGVGAGAAIPYQIGIQKNTATAKYTPKVPRIKKPAAKSAAITRRLESKK